ncbi:50S ribosomal protein L25 [Candidatus Saccharibacteria bacterium]|nr:50S ribosomal protein L25 [Candidatus Saccharibacteria bacterium]
MSTQTIELTLEPRKTVGKGLNAMRREGVVPAVIHNHGQQSILVSGKYRDFQVAYNKVGKSQAVTAKVDGKSYLTIIRDIDLDPAKSVIRHVVLQAIKQNEEIETEVPVVYAEGEIPAEKKGLLILKELDELSIKALPKDLPESIVVDLSSLEEAGDMVRVEALKAPAGVTILTTPDTPIAIVEMPRDQAAEADAAAAALAEDSDKPVAESVPVEGSTATEEESSEAKPAE